MPLDGLEAALGEPGLSQLERELILTEMGEWRDRLHLQRELEASASAVGTRRQPSSAIATRDWPLRKRARCIVESEEEEAGEDPSNNNNNSSNIGAAAVPSDSSGSEEEVVEMVVHEEGCDRCVARGRVCRGYPGQACEYCRTVARKCCELATHRRAARRLQNERAEREAREAQRCAMVQVLHLPVGPVLEVDDLEGLVVGANEGAVHFWMAMLARRARMLYRAVSQLRDLAHELMTEANMLVRVIRRGEEEGTRGEDDK
ncbi:hypothetical protein ACEPAI_1917 [Sanghuangporus weigelae]